MTYTATPLGGVVRDSDGAFIPQDPKNTDWIAYLAWASLGNTATVPQVSPAALQASLVSTVQGLMDTKAQAYGYDNITTAVTYADEPTVPKFQSEGQAFRAWRSDVWAACYSYLAQVQAGTKAFPTASDLPGLIPKFPLDTP
jgi:hypothetical protein